MKKIEHDQLIELSKRLKYFRKKLGFSSYEKLANDIGISRSQYGKYEKGGNIKYTTLCRILNHFDITIQEFFNQKINIK